jgi:integral membrane sensor domain MASE1
MPLSLHPTPTRPLWQPEWLSMYFFTREYYYLSIYY